MNRTRKLIFITVSILFLLACEIPALSAPAVTPQTGLIPVETIIAGTAAAAQTQTAVLFPSATKTSTSTPLPTATPTETATPTATVIFILPSPTEPFVPHSVGSACELTAIEPYNPVVNPNESFDISWTLKNTSDEVWLNQAIDFRYTSGKDMHAKDAYDLPQNVGPNGTVTLTVPMISPGKSGKYTTTWELILKKKTLCKVSATVYVR